MINFLSNYSHYIIGVVVIGSVVVAYIFREKRIVKEIVINAINEAEKRFNSGEGQKKLDYATDVVKQKLPKWLSIFVTKSVIVTVIEYFLNKGCVIFNVNKTVDIIGNDEVIENVSSKIDLGLDKSEISFSTNSTKVLSTETSEDKAEIYGAVKVSTDWHDKPNTSVEVGIKKKI